MGVVDTWGNSHLHGKAENPGWKIKWYEEPSNRLLMVRPVIKKIRDKRLKKQPVYSWLPNTQSQHSLLALSLLTNPDVSNGKPLYTRPIPFGKLQEIP